MTNEPQPQMDRVLPRKDLMLAQPEATRYVINSPSDSSRTR